MRLDLEQLRRAAGTAGIGMSRKRSAGLSAALIHRKGELEERGTPDREREAIDGEAEEVLRRIY
jgi:hypothetical protein